MPERVRNISDFALICDIEPAEPEMNTIIHENTSTTAVRMAVATSESVLRMPHLARIAVRAAKTAENTAAVSHINKTSFYEFSHPAEIVPAGFGVYAALAADFCSLILLIPPLPNIVPGMLIIIVPKQVKRPICSSVSTSLFLYLFSKPSLHLAAK